MKKILTISNHPGSANSIIPVIKILNKKYKVISIAEGASKGIFKKNNLKYKNIKDYRIKNPTPKYVKKILIRIKPDILFCGNSQDYSIENIFVFAAKEIKIKTVGILDLYRVNYYSTFYIHYKNKSISAIPGKLCVMDEWVKKRFTNIGINKRNLAVTGSPNFDYLIESRDDSKSKINRIKNKLGIKKTQKILLWISQPIEDDANINRGFNEKTALLDLIKVLKGTEIESYLLLLRLHPREKGKEIQNIIKNQNSPNIRLISNKISLVDTIIIPDIIIGIESTVLYESSLMGKKVISYFPSKTAKNMLEEAKRSTIVFTKTKGKLKKAILRLLKTKTSRKPKIFKPAAPRVAKVIEKELKSSRSKTRIHKV